jgi:GNAT superfamily N-acetyltransferase
VDEQHDGTQDSFPLLGVKVVQMTAEIRAAFPEDAAAICDVLHDSIQVCCKADHHDDPTIVSRWLANKTADNVRQWVAAPDAVTLVASRGDDLLGVALLRGHELALCYLVPRALYQGVGKALLQSVEKAASVRGVEVLTLDSTKTAFLFYSRNGFTACGPVRSWAGLEAQPMTKTLRACASSMGG